MKKILKYVLIGGFIFLFGWTIYFLYQKSETQPVVFKTQTPITTDIIKKTVATGSVVPRREVLIKPQVSGIVEKIMVIAGQKIEKGEVIARVRIIPDMVSLNEAEGRLERAKIAFDNSKIDYDRNLALLQKEVITKAEFQNVDVNFKNAKQEVELAENNLELIKEGATKKSGQVTNTLIRSTLSGMVLDVPVKEGSAVIQSNNFNDGTTIASVADMGEMIFEGKVDESEVGKLKSGMDLIMTVGAIEDKTFNAKLEYISPKGVSENGAIQFQIKAAIQLENDFFLRAGYSGNADVVLDRRNKVLALSESLLQFSHDSVFVEVETTPQKFEKRLIKTGLSDGINIEVLSGLKSTDKIKIHTPVEEAPPAQ